MYNILYVSFHCTVYTRVYSAVYTRVCHNSTKIEFQLRSLTLTLNILTRLRDNVFHILYLFLCLTSNIKKSTTECNLFVNLY